MSLTTGLQHSFREVSNNNGMNWLYNTVLEKTMRHKPMKILDALFKEQVKDMLLQPKVDVLLKEMVEFVLNSLFYRAALCLGVAH